MYFQYSNDFQNQVEFYLYLSFLSCFLYHSEAFGGTVTRAITRPRGEISGMVLPSLGANSPRYHLIYVTDAFFLFCRIVLQVQINTAVWQNGWRSGSV